MKLLNQHQVEIHFDLNKELAAVMSLLTRYRSVPASLADAELVRTAELYPNSLVFTLDSDFQIYRKNRKSPVLLIYPDGK